MTKLSEGELRRRAAALIAPMDQGELAVRIFEGALHLKRPAGSNLSEILPQIQRDADWLKAAENALLYLKECIDDAKRTS